MRKDALVVCLVWRMSYEEAEGKKWKDGQEAFSKAGRLGKAVVEVAIRHSTGGR